MSKKSVSSFGEQNLTVFMVRVFANDPGDRGSIPGRVIPKTQKMVLDSSLHYKVWIKDKVATEKGNLGSPLTTVANFFNYGCDGFFGETTG